MTAPAAVSWAAYLGWVDLGESWLWWLGHWIAVLIFTALALFELYNDQRPTTPSRTVPVQFGARLVMGALTGAALGVTSGSWIAGLVAGVVGSVIGTYAGKAARTYLAGEFGRDAPAAFIEDAAAIVGAILIVLAA
jgi:uncharacterized membrane protein